MTISTTAAHLLKWPWLATLILAAWMLSGCATPPAETSIFTSDLQPAPERVSPPETAPPTLTRAERRELRRLERAERQAAIAKLEAEAPNQIQPATQPEDPSPPENRPGLFARLFKSSPDQNAAPPPAAHDPIHLNPAPTVPELLSDVKLRPGLALEVTVLVAGQQEIETRASRISDNGTLVLPLLGAMNVTQFTLEELRRVLTGQYSRYYINPQVIVQFTRDSSSDGISPWGYVTVLGRVKNPGRIMIPATRDLTVSGAIQRAGGFDTSARINAIRVTRRGTGSEPEVRIINLNSVGADGRLEDDLLLVMDDVVFVPEARF
ncbi:MAG TPA: polysaccharide biosynthesis/export family protein [Kiritimatiellia bacterium]|nr:polysaccharide biosynthesis/export family protein [Kiritimatiellia bacterium]